MPLAGSDNVQPVRPLFRPEAGGGKGQSWLGEVVFLRPLSFIVYAVFSLCVITALVSFAFLGSYTRRSVVTGAVLPSGGLLKIYSPRPARVLERKVTEGQYVQAGQILFTLSDDFTLAKEGEPGREAVMLQNLAGKRANLQAERNSQITQNLQLREKLQRQIEGIQAELLQIDREIATQSERLESARENFQRQQNLAAQGFLAATALQQKKDESLEQQARLQAVQRTRLNLQREKSEREAELVGAVTVATREQQQLDRQSLELEQTELQNQAKFSITASQAGTVGAILAEPGQSVSQSALATLIPSNAPLEAQAFVPANSAGFLKPGLPVRLRYNAYPYQKFGQYLGHVAEVAKTPLAPSELPAVLASDRGNQVLYRVRIALDQQSVQVYGKNELLSPGTLFEADILQETRTIWEWVLEPLFSLKGQL
ncbi:HlyD family efflux transporter periplasmic adaptor subunit [Undibacterium sp. TS12]|uniref:HlyD family secretion protein n=1 Tax=Undibacterium sp. TS12 TaxID=2908202 RepID=UPI001F4CEA4F|nr:HlyD family efflux transporter periplasmic adaptor subunit [Undibacterium sp. TS12]MCH8620459.1 HlyD family secretion protein [Undibacterium sp. TS12]